MSEKQHIITNNVNNNIATTIPPTTTTNKHVHHPHYTTTSSIFSNKRLPIDISRELMDPVNIPSKFKLFQASTNNIGSIFGCVQYTLFDGLRVSARSLDSRLKATYESPTFKKNSNINNINKHLPVKTSISWYETPRGSREGDIGIATTNIYSIYKRGSVFQVGGAIGVRVHSFSRMIVSPFINPKFTYFGRYGWIKLDVPINKKSNRIVLKHHMFFQFGKNTFLSSLEISSRVGDISRYFSDHYYSNKVLNSDNESNTFSRSTSINNFNSINNNNNSSNNNDNNNKPTTTQSYNNNSSNDNHNRSQIFGLPSLFDYKNRITSGSRFFETIHYKIIHVSSATEFGIRRISKLYGTKYQLELGFKHQITQSGALQCLFTHTIGQKTTFGLSFGFDI